MKTLFTFSILLFTTLLFSQYNYGLEVEQRDAKIEGKLALGNSSDSNLFIGIDAGINNTTGLSNTSIGFNSGMSNSAKNANTTVGAEAGKYNESFINTLIGANSGRMITTGWGNTLLGYSSGTVLKGGSANVMLGRAAGFMNVSGSFNVFIGDSAGYHETGSRKLYIEASQWNENDNQMPLIYGEFDNDKAGINWDSSIPLPATFSVNGTAIVKDTTTLENILQLKPLDANMITQNTCNSGEVFYGDDDEFYVCKAGSWKQIVTN